MFFCYSAHTAHSGMPLHSTGFMHLPAAPAGVDRVEQYLPSLTVNFRIISHQHLCGLQSMLSFPGIF